MKPLVYFVVGVLLVLVLAEGVAASGAWLLGAHGHHDEEIEWLETVQPILVWDRSLDAQIGKLYLQRVRRDLDDDRLDRAVSSLRAARARARSRGEAPERDLMALGVETFTRAADRMEARGLLSSAAAWDESLFVMAVRAPLPHHRYAALAAFMEAIDLRVREGNPCAALSLVEWAKRGLGGEIPGFQPSVEEDLRIQCRQARSGR